jgi:hypothetical protein
MLLMVALCLAFAASPAQGRTKVPPAMKDAFTPVTISTVGPSTMPVQGTDGRWHVVYELELVNGKSLPATVQEVSVLDAARPARVIATFSGAEVVDRLRTLLPQPATDAVIAPNEMRFFYVELSFARRSDVPRYVTHRLRLLAADNPGATEPNEMTYTAGRYDIRGGRPIILSAPVRGPNWVAANGCCNADIVHRGSLQDVNGSFFNSQRFAIDWMRLNADGHFFTGDGSDVHQYADYDAPVQAVADGVVVSTLNTLDDQVPGTLPPPTSITLETVDGNHVVIALGHGLYAFYAHLRKGSVRVHRGERVHRGQIIGNLGNTGNTSAPHLHFHLMDGPSPLGSDGVPYVLRPFSLTGQVPVAEFDAAPGIAGFWGQDRFAARPQHRRFPLNLNIVTFPGRG